jgi:hypothetical protein
MYTCQVCIDRCSNILVVLFSNHQICHQIYDIIIIIIIITLLTITLIEMAFHVFTYKSIQAPT